MSGYGNDNTGSRGYGNDMTSGGYGGNQGSRIGEDTSFGRSSNTGGGYSGSDEYGSSGQGGLGSDNYNSSGTGSGLERQGNNYDSSDRSGSGRIGGAATSGAGFGNKSTSGMGNQSSLPSDYGTDNRQGSQLGGNSDPYSGSSEVRSGYAGGAGFGNKSSGYEPSSESGYGGNQDMARSSDPYGGSNEYGSGSRGGAGFGNKSSRGSDDNSSGGDSKAGKLMEKMGGMMGNQKMEQKGMEKREQAGYGEGQSSDY